MVSRKKPIIERVNNLLKSSGDETKSQSNHLVHSLRHRQRNSTASATVQVRAFPTNNEVKVACFSKLRRKHVAYNYGSFKFLRKFEILRIFLLRKDITTINFVFNDDIYIKRRFC